MNVTHFGHACVLLETDSARLLFDPGELSSDFESLTSIDAVLITHQHYDHLDLARLGPLLERNSGALLVVDPGSEETVSALGLDHRVVGPDDRLVIAGASVDVMGGQHAVIHADVPVVPNVAYLIDDGAFLHPGDSFFAPAAATVDVLGLPTGGPWLKASEAVDYLRVVAPRMALPIHQAVLSRPKSHYDLFTRLAPASTTVSLLPHAEAVKVA